MINNKYFNVQAPAIVPAGIAYQRPKLTGEITSWIDGDDGYHFLAGTYDYVPPTNPVYMAELDYDSADPIVTLKNPNAFGTLYRFTDIAGGQTFTNVYYIIDHLTGLGWYNSTVNLIDTWDVYVAYGLTLDTTADVGMYDDWRLANYNELVSTFNKPQLVSNTSNYFPLNSRLINIGMWNSAFIWSSTSVSLLAAYNYVPVSNGTISTATKVTTNRRAWYCRNHYN